MNSCSCLTLIVACIIYWQARDMFRVIRTVDPERHGIELSLLRHVSPIEWDNIVLYGEYVSSIADSSGGRAHGLSVQNRTDLPDTLEKGFEGPPFGRVSLMAFVAFFLYQDGFWVSFGSG